MKLTMLYPRLILFLALTGLISCDRSSKKDPDVTTKSDDSGSMVATAMPISDTNVRTLLAEGSKLYWSIPAAATTEKTTMDDIDEDEMVRLDPKKYPTLAELRDMLRPAFTAAAVDAILEDFSITERDGKLWILQGDGGDVRVYDEAQILESDVTTDSLNITVEIPLGDSGQTDVVEVQLKKAGNHWLIDSDPYGGNDEEGE